MNGNYCYNDVDISIVNEFPSFFPPEVYDIHAHVYRKSDLHLSSPSTLANGAELVGMKEWKNSVGAQVGKDRLIGGLFFPMPSKNCDLDKCNSFLVSELNGRSKGLILVFPDSKPDVIGKYLENPCIAGFKPYHLFSCQKPTFQASISSYLPDWALRTANERGLIITLHLVKDRALADQQNQEEIRTICSTYPDIKIILAHAGRGFHAFNTVNGIKALRGIENIWFDTSGICEAEALLAILKEFGPSKLLWGSDYPISQIRGKCVTVGDGFVWLDEANIDWSRISPVCNPTLVGLEALRALKQVADVFGLNKTDLQSIFCDNALKLLGIIKETGTLTQELYKHAKQIIPAGTQLLSKRPEMMAPDQWPAYFREARGCEIWDIDGKHYFDMVTNGIGSCLLGYRDDDVSRAVHRKIDLGSMSTLNPPEEVELAELLCEIHPWAEQVRFTRTGGETASVAIRIARAITGRSIVAICGYHGWYDWYLAANLGENDSLRGHLLPGLDPLGVPGELRETAVTFRYNRMDEYQAIIDNYGSRLAAVIMEPCRYNDPEPGFLEYVRDEAHRNGAILVFDEITIGWRLNFGGAHLKFEVNPDIAFFGKALGNGHPIGAVIGTKEAMAGAHKSFISSTYWTESIGPAAALATLEKMKRIDVPSHVAEIGNRVTGYWSLCGKKYDLPIMTGDGYPCMAHFKFDNALSEELRTLYTQLMLDRGFLGGTCIYPTLAHTVEIADMYGTAIDEVFAIISNAIQKDKVRESLKGPVAHSGFRRLI